MAKRLKKSGSGSGSGSSSESESDDSSSCGSSGSGSESENELDECPTKNEAAYLRIYEFVLQEVGFEKSQDGANYEAFVSRVDALNAEIDANAKHVHVICNQYADSRGIKRGSKWEKTEQMKEFYKKGDLPKRTDDKKRKKSKKDKKGKKKARYSLTKSAADSDSDSEDETGALASDFLMNEGLGNFGGLAEVLDRCALEKEPKASKSSKQDGQHLFSSSAVFSAVIETACHQYLLKNKSGFPPMKSAFEAPEGGPEPLSWTKDIVDKDKVQDMIASHPSSQTIIQNLRATNVSDAVNALVMECGRRFQSTYPGIVTRGEATELNPRGRYVYLEKHRSKMIKIRDEVIGDKIQRF